MFPLAFFVRAIWRDLRAKAAAGNGRVVSGMGMAYGVILNVNDWGWLIGAALGALLHTRFITRTSAVASVPAE
jgi:hypothetical protein